MTPVRVTAIGPVFWYIYSHSPAKRMNDLAWNELTWIGKNKIISYGAPIGFKTFCLFYRDHCMTILLRKQKQKLGFQNAINRRDKYKKELYVWDKFNTKSNVFDYHCKKMHTLIDA